VSRNPETSSQGQHTATTSINKVRDSALRQHLGEIRKDLSKIDDPIISRWGRYTQEYTALQLALVFNDLEVEVIVEGLLQAGANPNIKGVGGRTALSYAAVGGNLKAVKALIAAGAAINQPDNYGRTPLHTVVSVRLSYGQTPEDLEAEIERVVELLIKHPKVNLNLKDYVGRTPLRIATNRFKYDTHIPYILEQKELHNSSHNA
jgi:Ankyrin repeats (many copies)